jgi:hypothetical protein
VSKFALYLHDQNKLKTGQRMECPFRFLYNCYSITVFLFWSWHLFSLQSCNRCNPMCLQRVEKRWWKIINFLATHFQSIFLCEMAGKLITWTPVSQCFIFNRIMDRPADLSKTMTEKIAKLLPWGFMCTPVTPHWPPLLILVSTVATGTCCYIY